MRPILYLILLVSSSLSWASSEQDKLVSVYALYLQKLQVSQDMSSIIELIHVDLQSRYLKEMNTIKNQLMTDHKTSEALFLKQKSLSAKCLKPVFRSKEKANHLEKRRVFFTLTPVCGSRLPELHEVTFIKHEGFWKISHIASKSLPFSPLNF